MIFRYAEQVHDHRRRAELFRRHAAATRNPHTRKMYLRLATTEEALAEWAAGLAKLVQEDSEIDDGTPSLSSGYLPVESYDHGSELQPPMTTVASPFEELTS
jgi:hypothetical protein